MGEGRAGSPEDGWPSGGRLGGCHAGGQRHPVIPRVGGRASPCHRLGGGRVIPELPGWGTVEHAVPSATGRLRVWSLSVEYAAA